jgi:hypothetical protein
MLANLLTNLGFTRDSKIWSWSRWSALLALLASGAVDVVGLGNWLGIHLSDTAAHWVTAVAVAVLWFGGTYDTSPLPGASQKSAGSSTPPKVPVVLLALAIGGLLASGCGGRVPPALTSANPTDAQVQEVRRDAAEIAGAVKAGIAIVGEARTFANTAPLPQAAKDAINCSILKATGTTEPPAPVVVSVCGALPNGPGPLYQALDELAAVSSTPSLRTTVAALMRALDPVFAALQNSSNQALAGFAAALRGTFAYASGFLGGVQ